MPEIADLLHMCALCSEQPSHISTMLEPEPSKNIYRLRTPPAFNIVETDPLLNTGFTPRIEEEEIRKAGGVNCEKSPYCSGIYELCGAVAGAR